ncbi:ferrous iron transporter A [Chlorella sorokiniana]|uniref:Ferrous iron transporter A n=1 Tax=Chlorella sorokiniana TaxID=3076 RepID=A0A2P6U0D0_CHLSO|nr:ferrous iron transporter A [Chlorella sorokiniana]|eukprot:PRW59758.1 ferrous iron transporter A [Chlorella sorokiniana]
MGVDEVAVRAAAEARRGFILSNLDSMSLKSCRMTLEQDMGLETGALKQHKDLLSRLIDEFIAERDARPAAGGKANKEAEEDAEEEEEAASEEEASEPDYDDSEDEGRAKKQRKKGGAAKPAKRQKREEKAAKPSGPRQYGKRVEKLRSVCRAATITIPPSLYSRNKEEGALEAALEELLAKHGLDADSGERAIAQVKSKLTIQRDLDGIDTSNIIEGGRRRRGAAPVSYKALVQPASDDEEEEEQSGSEAGSDSDVEVPSGSDVEADSDDGGRAAKHKQKAAPAKKRQKQAGGSSKGKKAKAASDSEEEASSSEEEEEPAASEASVEEAASDSDGEPAAAARSPDENAAARGNGSGGRKGSKPPSSSKPAAKKRPAASLEDSDDEPTFDYTTLAAATADLQAWVPAKVEGVVQQEHATALRLRTATESGWLWLSYHARTAHVGVGDGPARGAAAELYTFGSQLQATLRGLVLTRIWMPTPYERVLKLAFAQRPGEPPAAELVYECMARYSNLLLVGPDSTVLAAAHQVGQRMSSVRHVQVGGRWDPPPPASGLDPDACASAEEWQEVLCRLAAEEPADRRPTLQQVAVRGFRGVSPQLARDLAQLAGVDPHAQPAELSPQQWAALWQAWQGWLAALSSGSFAASACPSSGAYSLLGVQPQPVPSLLPFLAAYYSAEQRADAFVALKQQLVKAVAGAIARLQKKVESLQKQGGDGDRHQATQKQADMIMGNVYRIPAGAASVEVEDWDTGAAVTLALDPEKTAVENAEALYKQARKQRRAVEQVAPLLEAARGELTYLSEVELMLQQLEGGSHLAALQEVQSDLVAGKYMKAPPEAALADKAASKARKAARRSASSGNTGGGAQDFRRYTSPSGLAVLVGRNSRQNDTLTMDMANPGDVWMHARGVPGAHLLMRVPAGQQPEAADLQFAADLAAWFSKARTDGKVDVTMCDPKHISKPTGAKPGQVMVRKESTVVGRPDQSAAAASGETD